MAETLPAMFGGTLDKETYPLTLTGDGWRVIRAALRDAEAHAEEEARYALDELRKFHGDAAHYKGVDTGAALACEHCSALPYGQAHAEARAERYRALARLVSETLGEG